jgi:hypothetical protein
VPDYRWIGQGIPIAYRSKRMKHTRFSLVLPLLLLLMTGIPAYALDGTLQVPGGGNVIVWRNSKAHSEGLNLIQANVHKTNPLLMIPLIACMPSSGTKAVTTDAGFLTHDILVVEGPSAGCRGNIAVEHFRFSGR